MTENQQDLMLWFLFGWVVIWPVLQLIWSAIYGVWHWAKNND